MTSLDFVTPRLRLVTVTPELMDADAARSERFPSLLGAEVPACWPPKDWEPHVFVFMKEQIVRSPYAAHWNRYVVLRGERPTLVGTLGGFPRSASEAEIGYSILEPWQRMGLATEGALALIRELFCESGLETISAQTFPELVASVGVLRRCGFRLVGKGEEEGAVRYRLDRAGLQGG